MMIFIFITFFPKASILWCIYCYLHLSQCFPLVLHLLKQWWTPPLGFKIVILPLLCTMLSVRLFFVGGRLFYLTLSMYCFQAFLIIIIFVIIVVIFVVIITWKVTNWDSMYTLYLPCIRGNVFEILLFSRRTLWSLLLESDQNSEHIICISYCYFF
jgi:hypothetical protein